MDGAYDLRAKLGLSQTALVRRIIELGDDRTERTILRSIQRMITGDARVSGEIRALLGLIAQYPMAIGKNAA